MLEETIIRESATNKLQTRGSVKGIGPPVTFANVVTPKADSMGAGGFAGAGGSAQITVDSLANEGLSDSTFDALT